MKYVFTFENKNSYGFNVPIELFAYDLSTQYDGGKSLLEQNEFSPRCYELVKIVDAQKGDVVWTRK